MGQEAPLAPVRVARAGLSLAVPRHAGAVADRVRVQRPARFGIVLSGFACGVLALGLNEGAYMAEIIRSGIRAVGDRASGSPPARSA